MAPVGVAKVGRGGGECILLCQVPSKPCRRKVGKTVLISHTGNSMFTMNAWLVATCHSMAKLHISK